jgi:hypothetical protein
MVTKNSYQQLNGSQYGWTSSPLEQEEHSCGKGWALDCNQPDAHEGSGKGWGRQTETTDQGSGKGWACCF